MKIALFGTVGAGKSTVSEKISEKFGYEIFPEPIDNNPYFDEYYRDMESKIFKMQIFMLTARSIQLYRAENLDNVIFDRTILEDPIFVDVNKEIGNINDVDYKTYTDFYESVIIPNLENRVDFDIIIYLKVSTDKAIERIKERGRIQELDTDREYWEVLNRKYEEFYEKRKDKFNFLVVDAETDDMDAKMKIIFDALYKMNPELKK